MTVREPGFSSVKTRKPKQLVGFPSVEDGVHEVIIILADDGSVWRLPNPGKNTEWQKLPSLPDGWDTQGASDFNAITYLRAKY